MAPTDEEIIGILSSHHFVFFPALANLKQTTTVCFASNSYYLSVLINQMFVLGRLQAQI